MNKAKESLSKKNQRMHYSVGAVIEKEGKYLLIDRAVPPFGFAGIAGHIDEGETPEQALKRELKEESDLGLEEAKLLFKGEQENNTCSKGVTTHYWYLFACKAKGEMKKNERETKSINWYTKEEIKKLNLEPIWNYWLKKCKII